MIFFFFFVFQILSFFFPVFFFQIKKMKTKNKKNEKRKKEKTKTKKLKTKKLQNEKPTGWTIILCGRVNMADGVIEQTERGFEDDVSPGKYPQFTSIP